MKIGQTIAGGITSNTNQSTFSLQKGMTFLGRAILMDGQMIDLVTANGAKIKAFANLSGTIPMNVSLKFEVVDSTESLLVIRPVIEDAEKASSLDQMVKGFLIEMGLKPSDENAKFFKEQDFLFGNSLENVISLLGDDPQVLESLTLDIKSLKEYIKDYDSDGAEKFLNKLSNIISRAKQRGGLSKPLINSLSGLLKGMLIQSNLTYPVVFIPLPLNFENKIYNGEILIENEDEGDNKKAAVAYIIADTPSGRVEAEAKSVDNLLELDIYCGKKLIPQFDKHNDDIKNAVSGSGFILKRFNVSELKNKRSFMDIAKKYVKPFKPLDVKV